VQQVSNAVRKRVDAEAVLGGADLATPRALTRDGDMPACTSDHTHGPLPHNRAQRIGAVAGLAVICTLLLVTACYCLACVRRMLFPARCVTATAPAREESKVRAPCPTLLPRCLLQAAASAAQVA
jgi:hypothetical protein